MLLELRIEHFALIEHLNLGFSPGLNVLSGETGAGKSIILDAVAAILGGRTSAEVVRTGEERAVVEAVFALSDERRADLAAQGLADADDDVLVVRREVARGGRSVIRVNGKTVTAGMLKEAVAGLVDLHGQHEHQSLLQQEKHIELLDQYGGSLMQQEGKSLDLLDAYAGGPIPELRERLASQVAGLRKLQTEIDSLGGDARDRARREDLLRYQVEELAKARLQPTEEEDLAAELRLLEHAGRLKWVAQSSYGWLYEGEGRQLAATDLIGRASAELADASRHDPSLAPVLDLLEGAAAQIQEASHFLAGYKERIEDNPQRMQAVQARLDLIHDLKRKYGESIPAVLRYLGEIKEELDGLASREERVATLTAELERQGALVAETARLLTAARQKAAGELSGRVARELADLGMPRAQFQVSIQSAESPTAVTTRGWDRVEFLFSPNVGEPPKPLAKVVSGGEMSRIMLALKVILARVDGVPTLVFDEVDSGISGRAAQAVAEKLARIAGDRQVLCVTHLPQVAAMADKHLGIEKGEVQGRTQTSVYELDEAGRTLEIARMIGGTSLTDLTRQSAAEIIRQAETQKRSLRGA